MGERSQIIVTSLCLVCEATQRLIETRSNLHELVLRMETSRQNQQDRMK